MKEFIDKHHDIIEKYYRVMDQSTGRNAKTIIPKLRQLIEQDPDFYDPYISLKELYYKVNKGPIGDKLINDGSKRALSRIVDKKGNWPERLEWLYLENRHIIRILLNQGIFYWENAQEEEALDLLRKLLKSNPNDNIGARFFILAIRMGMSFNDYEKRFNKGGYYDKDINKWFEANYKKFPEEFEWWDKTTEDKGGINEDLEAESSEDNSDMSIFMIKNIFEKLGISKDKFIKEFGKLIESLAPPNIELPSKTGVPHETMIFQLKITLKGISPPVWRRILIEDTATFAQLHDAIQSFFGWDNDHLHDFTVTINKSVRRTITIKGLTPFGDLPDSGCDDDFIETDIQLRDFLSLDRRKLLYTYDFGDNWEHVVYLEEIKSLDPTLKYPICIKEKGVIPTDD